MGPLHGIKIVEFAGLGPGPMAAMLLADMGAAVLRIERPGEPVPAHADPVMRSRDSVPLDLKVPADAEHALQLAGLADALIEGFRPGVMESLGLGPAECFARNQALVYARMTGWGQTGPLASRAGHDLNYIALSGALDRIGSTGGPPVIPLNLVGDYGGGALYLALGILAGILSARQSGKGQILDVAMIDGAASLMSKQYGLLAAGALQPDRGTNLLDGGAPFYSVYSCADGRYVAVGAIEAKFFAALLHGLEIEPASLKPQHDREGWPHMRHLFTARFAMHSRDFWAAHFAETDACVTPVLSMQEAPLHPHVSARRTFIELADVLQPAPAPRFSGTPSAATPPARRDAAAARRAWDAGAP